MNRQRHCSGGCYVLVSDCIAVDAFEMAAQYQKWRRRKSTRQLQSTDALNRIDLGSTRPLVRFPVTWKFGMAGQNF